jgi:hypothetical protein
MRLDRCDQHGTQCTKKAIADAARMIEMSAIASFGISARPIFSQWPTSFINK